MLDIIPATLSYPYRIFFL